MFKFVKHKNVKHSGCEKTIIKLEKKYNIKFPKILKDYYINYDTEEIEHCLLLNGNLGVDEIVPIDGDNWFTFEKLKDSDLEDGFIPKNMYPLALDSGGDCFYWDSETENIYFYNHEFIDNPKYIAENVKEFFELMNNGIENNEELSNVPLVDTVVEKIKLLEVGTETSIAMLLQEFSSNDLDSEELFDLMLAIFEKCRKEGITLDFSKYEDIENSLLFNIPFVKK